MKYLWDNIYLTKDERSQLIALLFILLTLIIVKFSVVVFYQPQTIPIDPYVLDSVKYVTITNTYNSSDPKKEYNIEEKRKSRTPKIPSVKYKKKDIPPQIFNFNPNTINRDSLELLGFSRYAINSLLKYRSKGGKIKSVEQMSKINGLELATLERIRNSITIPPTPKKLFAKNQDSTYTKYKTTPSKNQSKYRAYKKKTPKIFEINTGDTTDFQNLYGIGKVYSKRIINFRKSLGGFFTIQQIGDVWGIEDSLFQSIKPYLTVDPSLIQKRNINNMDRDSMNRHPYIDWDKSKAILKYKETHGPYKTMDDFYKLYLLEDDFVDTMKLYFFVE